MKEFNIQNGEGEFIIHIAGDNSRYTVTYDHGQIIFENAGLKYVIPAEVGDKASFFKPDPNTGKSNYLLTNIRNLYRDTTPTDFGLGSSIIDAEPNSSHFTEEIMVGGINESIPVIAPNGVIIYVNGNAVSSGTEVDNGDVVKFEIFANSEFETTDNYTLSVGDITKIFNISTRLGLVANWSGGNVVNNGFGNGTLDNVGADTVNGYWHIADVNDNITLYNMPTDNFELSFDIRIHNTTTHSSSDGAGVIWFDQNVSNKTAIHYNNNSFYFANVAGWQIGTTRTAAVNNWYNLKIRVVNGLASYYYNDVMVTENNNIGIIGSVWNFSNYSHFDGNTNNHFARADYNNIKVETISGSSKGTVTNPFISTTEAMSEGASTGIQYFKNNNGDIQPLFYKDGWILIASNNAKASVIPSGTARNNNNYTINRNGTLGALGTPSPESDYIIGDFISSFPFTNGRILGWGRGSTNNTYSLYPKENLGEYVDVQWTVSSFDTVTPRANVTVFGNGSLNTNAAYFVLDGVKKDISLNANSNQSTVGGCGVIASNGDPSSGCYLGHGSSEGSFEGWYNTSGNANAQGYTTWIK